MWRVWTRALSQNMGHYNVHFLLLCEWWEPNWWVFHCYAGGGSTPASAVATGHAGPLEEGTGAGGGGGSGMFASGIIQVTPQDKEAIERVSW